MDDKLEEWRAFALDMTVLPIEYSDARKLADNLLDACDCIEKLMSGLNKAYELAFAVNNLDIYGDIDGDLSVSINAREMKRLIVAFEAFTGKEWDQSPEIEP